MTELDDYLEPLGAPDWADVADHAVEGDVRHYSLPDDAAADWALRKLAAAKAKVDAAEETAAERRALIDRWLGVREARTTYTVDV